MRCNVSKSVLVLSCGVAFIIFSCSSKDGIQEKTINLSQNEIHFTSSESAATVTTEGEFWWISSVALDERVIDIEDVTTTNSSFEIIDTAFTITRNSTTELAITMEANPTSIERKLFIFLSEGNTGDLLTITQEGQ